MQLLQHHVRPYAWGSRTAIADLLGVAPNGEPQAEMWLGAHPDSPSTLLGSGRGAGARLDAAIAADPEALLGPAVRQGFDDRLPYLMKVLAAASPLSLQVHPTMEQARAGYAQEERNGVPQDAAERRYKDPFHKPEMILALTPFDALCGLRPLAQTRPLLARLDVRHQDWAPLLALIEGADGPDDSDGPDDPGALREVCARLLRGTGGTSLVDAVVAACTAVDEPGCRTAVELARAYPGDPGLILSLLMHRVTLAPGEALYLPAGNVHAYLAGTGIEIMAASDNVLRAGLTPKHVDVDEVLRLVDFAPAPVPRVEPQVDGPTTSYRPGAAEFELHVVRCGTVAAAVPVPAGGPRIVLCLEGRVEVVTELAEVELPRGASVFVPDAEGEIALGGRGTAVVAAVPGVTPVLRR